MNRTEKAFTCTGVALVVAAAVTFIVRLGEIDHVTQPLAAAGTAFVVAALALRRRRR